ncbi:ArsR family transcriptional regulator [Sulfolobus sp. E5-1-F]|uniref:ArsR/SmtB family transcription factor n=1 Tax=Sulfolobaceae TaxID=118883 RepID=UPI001296573E|nr:MULTISPECIES: winged helix-turn-helix domain-containing protein [unclassified Sulfolobus]QGA53347.1 ArsR family transcriptional regulator [Sulfolobus sp. E5-1-F]QGA68454.1 ArsR family transcriptional regulator [Sulfolobus sp. E11-6]
MLLRLDEIFQNKGWDTRKKILNELKNKPQTAYELSKKLGLNYSTVKYHLEILEKVGLINVNRYKTKYFYVISKNYKIVEKYLEEEIAKR